MAEAETVLVATKQPLGWWKGLALTLVTGTALSSLLPYALILTYVAETVIFDRRVRHEPLFSVLPSPKAVGLLMVVLVAVAPAMFSFVAIPVMLSYAMMRCVAGYVYLSRLRRMMIGLLLGVSAETTIPLFLSPKGSFWQRIMAPHPSLLPLLTAAFTGLALGALIRPRWLGLSAPFRNSS